MGTTFAITHTFKGGTAEQYDRSIEVVHPDNGKGLPAGQTYHAAGVTSDGPSSSPYGTPRLHG